MVTIEGGRKKWGSALAKMRGIGKARKGELLLPIASWYRGPTMLLYTMWPSLPPKCVASSEVVSGCLAWSLTHAFVDPVDFIAPAIIRQKFLHVLMFPSSSSDEQRAQSLSRLHSHAEST